MTALPEVEIRPASSSDLDAVMAIEERSFSTPWRRVVFGSLLSRSDTDFLVAVRSGDVVGYTVVWTTMDESELANVAVSERARREGIGSRLVGAAVSAARARGARRIFLEVRESNRGAADLYARMGFVHIGVRAAYYTSPKEDALVLALTLDQAEGRPEG